MTVKVIELVGNSSESWEDAAQSALDEPLENISGIEIASQTAEVENGEIQQYRTTVHVSFDLQR